ncbi:MAG: 3-hydroxyacyl-CoA dehydrogenase NAD-binding domain-containing protein, partial [Anaerolineae bacterium]
ASQADFIVEAVFENLDVKREVLRQLEEHCPAHAVITSTTSSFCVRDMAVALSHPERFLVTHFWNPPYVIPVVEVMPGDHTSAEAVETTITLLEAVGKYPALVKKDVPGFVGNRLQHALRREAIAIVAEGIASPEDVDLIARLSFGLRLPVVGPLETVDLGGLDLTQAIQTYLLPDLDRSTEPTQLIRDKVKRGELGAKAGKGFYDWPPGRAARVIRQRDEALLEMVRRLRARGFLQTLRVSETLRVSFKGRAILPGNIEGEALVTHVGFNAYASFYTSIHAQVEIAQCADSGNQELHGKNLTDKILCLPKTTGSTSAGAVWQRVAQMGIAPKAMLFSQRIDSLAAGGLIVADLWAGKRIYTVDQLGDEFLESVKDGDRIAIREDGTVTIQ